MAMEQFEKWWKSAFCDIPTITDEDYDYYKGTKQGWRAALEFIKRESRAARDSFEPDFRFHSLLRRELEDE